MGQAKSTPKKVLVIGLDAAGKSSVSYIRSKILKDLVI
jgi:hypothetical protein